MTPTRRQIRQLIREELSRALREGWDDEPAEEEGGGYDYPMGPDTIEWTDGEIDLKWLDKKLAGYKRPPGSLFKGEAIRDFKDMLKGKPVDSDVVARYVNPDGTSVVTRQTIEALVKSLEHHDAKIPQSWYPGWNDYEMVYVRSPEGDVEVHRRPLRK